MSPTVPWTWISAFETTFEKRKHVCFGSILLIGNDRIDSIV